MARKKIREYDSKRLLKEHLKRIARIELEIRSAQVGSRPFDRDPSDSPAFFFPCPLDCFDR